MMSEAEALEIYDLVGGRLKFLTAAAGALKKTSFPGLLGLLPRNVAEIILILLSQPGRAQCSVLPAKLSTMPTWL